MVKPTEKPNTPRTVVASANAVRIAPRKLRLVTNLIKRMPVAQAIVQLQFTNKKGAPILIKLLKSAVANAENNFSIKPDDLYIKSITCNMGQTMSRYFPRARGAAFVIRRKSSHIDLVLEEKKSSKKKAGIIKSAVKAAKPKANIGTPDTFIDSKLESKVTKAKQDPIKTSEEVKEQTITQKRRPQAK